MGGQVMSESQERARHALSKSAVALVVGWVLVASGCTAGEVSRAGEAPSLLRSATGVGYGVRHAPRKRRAGQAVQRVGRRSPGCASVPEGWLGQAVSEEEVLAPFLACGSVADFLALQRGVDMAGLVERLGQWSAVRLGAQGPLVDSGAAKILTRKRAGFLLTITVDYGAYAQVFALFLVHTALDDELRELLGLLAREKQLAQTLGAMEAVRAELERRGLKLSEYAEREERAGDVLRGLGRAGRDALNSTAVSDGARYMRMREQGAQLPPAYQQALEEVERALVSGHYTPGNMALGSFDTLTFGVPLGFYHLAAGAAHGVEELRQGQYEQATRELAPAALLVALYAGGKGARYLSRAEGAGVGLSLPEVRLEALQQVAWQLGERLGLEGVVEVARYLRASREAAVFVGAGGEPAAVALHEARGSVARAQAYLSKALPESPGAPEPRAAGGRALGGMASLVDEAAGYSVEVVEAKLLQAELEAPGPRLPADAALLRKLNATLASPPPGMPEGHALWSDYLRYRQRRLAEVERGTAKQGPLRWEAYELMRGAFARGLAFERAMVSVLRADAALPRAQRRWLKAFTQPLVETHVGMSKPGVEGRRFADVLIIEQQPPAGQPPRVETLSFKSRNLAPLDPELLKDRIEMDARAALDYYGGTVDILRPTLKRRVQVQHVRLVYEGGQFMPESLESMRRAVNAIQKQFKGVEVLVQ